MQRIVGIDPGLGGGIAEVTGTPWAVKMPTVPGKGSKRELDGPKIRNLLACFGNGKPFVWIELVHSMPKQGVASSFTFGDGYGTIKGILIGLQIPYDFVRPQAWQKFFGISNKGGESKKQSVLKAKRYFPTVEFGNHHGMSDALLIAEWARRNRT